MNATWPETDLSEFDALGGIERGAWTGLFNGGFLQATSFDKNPDSVFMGKAECEWVPFRTFWLGKMVDLGWISVASKTRTAADNGWTYQLEITDKGHDIRKAELDRWRKLSAVRTIQEFGQFLDGQDGWWSY